MPMFSRSATCRRNDNVRVENDPDHEPGAAGIHAVPSVPRRSPRHGRHGVNPGCTGLMIRVILDTNIIVSAACGRPAEHGHLYALSGASDLPAPVPETVIVGGSGSGLLPHSARAEAGTGGCREDLLLRRSS